MPDDVCGICGNDWPRQFMILLTYDEFAGWCTVGAVEEPLYNIQMVYYCLEFTIDCAVLNSNTCIIQF